MVKKLTRATPKKKQASAPKKVVKRKVVKPVAKKKVAAKAKPVKKKVVLVCWEESLVERLDDIDARLAVLDERVVALVKAIVDLVGGLKDSITGGCNAKAKRRKAGERKEESDCFPEDSQEYRVGREGCKE